MLLLPLLPAENHKAATASLDTPCRFHDWAAVSKSDEQRRVKTRKLLDQGSLHTGTDYEEAAFIFQHSLTADDYLLAHTLAMVAITKGDSTAIWIATATLDRYLQSIGQKQIDGTQFRKIKDAWTQEPLNKQLIADPLRAQLGTQPQSVDEQRLQWIPTPTTADARRPRHSLGRLETRPSI